MSTPFGPSESVDSTKLAALAGELAKHIKTEQDIASLSRQLLKLTVESALNAELEAHLGYAKHAVEGRGTGNSRNGRSGKTLKGEIGEVAIRTPRDRNGSFEPQQGSQRIAREGTMLLHDQVGEQRPFLAGQGQLVVTEFQLDRAEQGDFRLC